MIVPLRALLIVGLAAWLLLRPRTRSPAALALVVGVVGIVILTEAWLSRPANLWIQAVAFAIAAGIAATEPPWLRVPTTKLGFSHLFASVDRDVKQAMLRLEHDRRAGRASEKTYVRRFERLAEPIRELRPPDGPWQDVVRERLSILDDWRSVFEAPGVVTERTYEELGRRERELQARVRELARRE